MTRLFPQQLARAISLLMVLCLSGELGAQETVPPPETAPPVTAPAPESLPPTPATPTTQQTDPCADLRAQLKRLSAGKKRRPHSVKRRSSSRKSLKKIKKVKTSRSRVGKLSSGATATALPDCSGAMSMKEVNEVLSTTRDLSGRNLNCLDFTGYNLKGVNFSGATMISTICTRAIMEDTNLERTNLTGADLRRVNLHLARLAATTFTNAKMDGALWTDRRPCAPGSIGACRDTFQR